MRIRTVKPDFFVHEGLASCDAHARLLAIGLLCLADVDGRLRWLPPQIHGNVFPYEPHVSVVKLGKQLERIGFISVYEVDGKEYAVVRNFKSHQRISGKEANTVSRYPAPNDANAKAKEGSTQGSAEVLHGEPREVGSRKEEMGSRKRSDAADAAASLDEAKELRDWLKWWNSLASEKLVPHGVNEHEPSQGAVEGWKRVQREPKLQAMLKDRDAIEREIRASDFCRESWFSIEKVLGGKNRDKEFILAKLIRGDYRNGERKNTSRPPVVKIGKATPISEL